MMSSCMEEDTPKWLRGRVVAWSRGLAVLRLATPRPRDPATPSLLRGGALGGFGQARLVAVRGVALDQPLLGGLVDLGETGGHRARVGDRAAGLLQRRAEA